MVLQSTGNSARRAAHSENTPPQVFQDARGAAKALTSRLQDTLNQRRRSRNNASSPYSTKYKIEQARKKRTGHNHSVTSQLKFIIATSLPSPTDVEMKDATSSKAPETKKAPLQLPRELPRPEFKEINLDIITAIDPAVGASHLDYIRESLSMLSSELMQSLASVRINNPSDKLPSEIPVTITDKTQIMPSHLLAVFGKRPPTPSGQAPTPTKVTLFPVHSLVLAAHCANLPVPPTPLPVPVQEEGTSVQQADLKVWSICLPSPNTYPQLSTYLYTKQAQPLMAHVLPCAPPTNIVDEPSKFVMPYAAYLARTFTVAALVKYVHNVHGLWMNMCALGIFEPRLWEIVDVMWQAMLTALAFATGDKDLAMKITAPATRQAQAQQQQTPTESS